MAKINPEEVVARFMGAVVEIHARIDIYLQRVEADDWKDMAELLTMVEELGRAGARVYNSAQKMSGDSDYSLADVVRMIRQHKS